MHCLRRYEPISNFRSETKTKGTVSEIGSRSVSDHPLIIEGDHDERIGKVLNIAGVGRFPPVRVKETKDPASPDTAVRDFVEVIRTDMKESNLF